MAKVARLFPYRDTSGKLMFRGRVGADTGDVTKVSKFFPYRSSDGALLLRGANSSGDVLKGFPYRGADGTLYARTLGQDVVTPCDGSFQAPGCSPASGYGTATITFSNGVTASSAVALGSLVGGPPNYCGLINQWGGIPEPSFVVRYWRAPDGSYRQYYAYENNNLPCVYEDGTFKLYTRVVVIAWGWITWEFFAEWNREFEYWYPGVKSPWARLVLGDHWVRADNRSGLVWTGCSGGYSNNCDININSEHGVSRLAFSVS